jgi:inosose dehydratase
MNKREFIKKSLAGVVAGSALTVTNALGQKVAKKKEDPFKLGIAGYSFVHFKLDQALEMMKRVDVNYLCIKDFHLPFKSTAEEIKNFHDTLAKSNVTGYAVGPIYMKTRQDIDNGFEYAKRVGVKLIVGIPNHEDLEYLSNKCKEYDFRYAIHNHGPEDKLYPDATSVYSRVKHLDKRLGLCFDIGHNLRYGMDPIKDIERYHDRIFDLHLKNITQANGDGKTCELSRGVIDIQGLIKALRKVKYSGMCSLEYEKDMKDPLAGIAESVGYYRGVVSSI